MSNQIENINIQSPEQALNDAENFQELRRIGLSTITQTGHEGWTDYNEHDPGITILETLIYGLTDLGYRTDFPLTDILAQQGLSSEELASKQFYTARNILTTNPVTFQDLRKLIIDQEGVENAWIQKTGDTINPFGGLIDIYVDLDSKITDQRKIHKIRKQVEEAYYGHRGLGQDLMKVIIRKPLEIILNLNLIVNPTAVVEEVLAKVLFELSEELSSAVNFLSLQEMMDKEGGDVNKVFDGPALVHGFLPDDALSSMRQVLRSVDLSHPLLKIPEVVEVSELGLQTAAQVQAAQVHSIGTKQKSSDIIKWLNQLKIDKNEKTILGPLEKHQFNIYKGDTPTKVNLYKLSLAFKKLYKSRRAAKLSPQKRDVPIPEGSYRDINYYYSIQEDFPMIYGLDPHGPPPQASETRLAQIKQLKAYLLLFDQIMANYLAQLSNLGQLFSWDKNIARTYFFQGLESAVSNIGELLDGAPIDDGAADHSNSAWAKIIQDYQYKLALFREDETTFLNRRNRFLNHLLARFGRDLTSYAESINQDSLASQQKVEIETKQRILDQYTVLSAQRNRAFHQLKNSRLNEDFSGLRLWVETLFDMLPENQEVLHFNKRFIQKVYDPKLNTQHVFSKYVLATADDSRLDLKELMRIGRDKENYSVDYQSDQGLHHISLFKVTDPSKPSKMYKLTDAYKNPEDTLEAIDDLAELLGQFDKASERVYLIEHVLLKPTAIESYFGLELLDEQGEVWMKTAEWYPKEILAQIALQIDPEEQFYYCIKNKIECSKELVDKKKSTREKIVKKTITAKYNFSILPIDATAKFVRFKIELKFGNPNGGLVEMHSVEPFESEEIAQKKIENWISQLKQKNQTSLQHKAILWKPLLKPWIAPLKKKGPLHQVLRDPYSFVLTVIIPNWPSRFQDKGFKKALEKTIASECPAHLYPNVLWLGKAKFQRFQSIYQLWWSAYSKGEPGAWCYRADLMDFIMKYSFPKKVLKKYQSKKKAKV